ncbi:MAG: hypothetical protein ABI323_00255, partial [Solirubrobacteraceae bacterium]
MKAIRHPSVHLLVALAALVLAGCGSSSSSSSAAHSASATASGSASATSTSASASNSTSPVLPPAVAELPAAQHPRSAQFPPARGRSLMQLGALVKS